MKISIENPRENITNTLRRAGYFFQGKKGDELEFVRTLARSGYPRFHVYARQNHQEINLNIHLDQKKHTYGDETRHHGEYEDCNLLDAEISRIRSLLV